MLLRHNVPAFSPVLQLGNFFLQINLKTKQKYGAGIGGEKDEFWHSQISARTAATEALQNVYPSLWM